MAWARDDSRARNFSYLIHAMRYALPDSFHLLCAGNYIFGKFHARSREHNFRAILRREMGGRGSFPTKLSLALTLHPQWVWRWWERGILSFPPVNSIEKPVENVLQWLRGHSMVECSIFVFPFFLYSGRGFCWLAWKAKREVQTTIMSSFRIKWFSFDFDWVKAWSERKNAFRAGRACVEGEDFPLDWILPSRNRFGMETQSREKIAQSFRLRFAKLTKFRFAFHS